MDKQEMLAYLKAMIAITSKAGNSEGARAYRDMYDMVEGGAFDKD